LRGLAERLRRAVGDGGSIFVTDIHPETKARLGWRRGFKADGESLEITTFDRTLDEIVRTFEPCGFDVRALIQPGFGEAERTVFAGAEKIGEFERTAGMPAIYVLQLAARKARTVESIGGREEGKVSSVSGGTIALGAGESVAATMAISSGRVSRLTDASSTLSPANPVAAGQIDLSGFLILPGLINAHDHLEFALFPRLGRGGYANFLQWAQDIHGSAARVILEQRSVPRETRLRWGGIRNLLCGVTTVCHHNPYEVEVFERGFPVRVLKEFGWAHSVALDNELAEKRDATLQTEPFILHLGEGIDEQSGEELFRLEGEYRVDERSVLVHGLGLTEEGWTLLRERRAKLIWCPSSNTFLFGRTLQAEKLRSLPSVALGSDSPLTANGDLLDEIRFARECGATAEEIYAMVTSNAAQVLLMRGGEGTLRVDAPADFFAVEDRGESPAEALATLSCADVKLVVIGGEVRLAAPEILGRLDATWTARLEPMHIEGQVRWVRQNVRRLFEEAQTHLQGEIRLGGKRVECDVADSHS